MILKNCGVLLMVLSFVCCARTKVYADGLDNVETDVEKRFAYWPSMHNAMSIRLRKRSIPTTTGQTEGGEVLAVPPGSASNDAAIKSNQSTNETQNNPNSTNNGTTISDNALKDTLVKLPDVNSNTSTAINNMNVTGNNTSDKATAISSMIPKQLNLHDPGVLMRGVIVFGGFLLMAVFYYIFYRTKTNKNNGNTNTNDMNQFRYGVLNNEDRRGNTELSRVPLTLESDDDEDEDLEIFDLGQKKQSLSYVNLHTNDEDIVFERSDNKGDDKNNLLLDIEDASSDPLINWSSNGSKSIL